MTPRELIEEAAAVTAARMIEEFKKQQAEQTLTAEQVAQFLNLDVKTVYEKAKTGKLPAHRVGRSVFFVWSEIVEATKIPIGPDMRQDRVRASA